ncbi:LuxR C-terminal-related transcriptional regulator [Cryobacterium sp. 1639]|uniref:LuxR C-terminal-related transcriptional regulator n=1 Tax=Cryobacterium inferilacus TaxID=2866629 RepID=UPI001C734498|nr:LuxR C-terminal-related transcriptional regulator [Cryobacterium sp. 1639]MBX0298495.1 LuxR C-terminal-related transcriptional regulator [Cryobacterium sp. 1639]
MAPPVAPAPPPAPEPQPSALRSSLWPDQADYTLPAGVADEPAWYLHRARLDSLLERLADPDARILALWDTAGAGKTTAMAGWARNLVAANRRVTWLAAADPRTLTGPAEIRRRLLSLVAVADAADGPEFVFVDDLPSDIGNLAGLFSALAGSPAGVRLVVSGRHRPGVGLAALEASGALIACADDALAFTLPETLQLAEHHQINLPAQDAAVLWRHTGGWATGVALALTWRRNEGEAGDLEHFDGDNPAVADYLATEVVAGLVPGDREVLLQSALGDVVPLELAVAVSQRADAGAVLERLARRRTLITREHDVHGPTAYRYHPLLLSYLQAEAQRHDAGAATGRHLLASRWYSARSDGTAALEQALLTHEPHLCAELLDRFGLGLVLTGQAEVVSRALGEVEGRVVSPAAECLRLALEPLEGPARRRTQQLFEAAGAVIQAGGDAGRTAYPPVAWRFVLAILRALHVTERAQVEEALRALHDQTGAVARLDPAVDLLAAMAEGRCLDRLGQSAAAEDILREVAETAGETGLHWLFLQATDLAATAAGHAGNWLHVARLEGQLAAAVLTEAAQTDAASTGAASTGAVPIGAVGTVPIGAVPAHRVPADPAPPVTNATSRALLYAMIRRYDRCRPVDLALLRELATGGDAGVCVPAEVLLLLAELEHPAHTRQSLDRLMLLMREMGVDHPRALSLCCVPVIEVSGALDGRAENTLFVRLIERALGENSLEALLGQFLLVPPSRSGHPAEERLRAAALDEGTAWRGATIVSAWIALAHAADVAGRHVESDTRLLRALRLGSRIGCERAFISGSGQGVALIRARIGRLGDLDDFARQVLAAATDLSTDEGAQAQDRPSGSVLTPRERDVLRELPFHQSVADIARKRNVSPNTVKTHLRNIYQKLEAADRADAVARAQDLGLL